MNSIGKSALGLAAASLLTRRNQCLQQTDELRTCPAEQFRLAISISWKDTTPGFYERLMQRSCFGRCRSSRLDGDMMLSDSADLQENL